MKKKSTRWRYLAWAFSLTFVACTNDDTSTLCSLTASPDVVLAYTHSADYATYKLDWIEKNNSTFTVKANQLSVASSGLKSPTFTSDYILLVDSSASGKLYVYKRSDLTLAGQITLGDYPQEMALVGCVAYIPLYGGFASASDTLKRVDLSALPSLSLLSDITVGQKPSPIRKFSSDKVYVANQDSLNKSQASVSIISILTDTVTTNINVGENPSDLQSDGTRVWSYNAKWFGGTAASLTYFPLSGGTPTNITTFPTVYAPAFGGRMAFSNSLGYLLLTNGTTLSDGSSLFHLFSISGTTVNSTAVDATNQYRFVGAGGTYLYKIHNGDGSTSALTTTIENMNGTVVTTQTLTKDSDMAFWPGH
ncbi:MAG: hypothetical protein LDLANPLL_02105 [Turneriella sp.]|nr:hypothetical protein [Turneriella sp.]